MFSDKLQAFFKLIRWQNLLIVALTQFLIRQFIIKPEIFNYKAYVSLALNEWEFALLILATVFITAGGYIINDYFDVNPDSVNKPSRVTIGKYFSKKQAFRFHLAFNIAGSLLGLFAGWLAGNWKVGMIFFIAAGLLWFYAKSFKQQFLIGNLLVSLLTAVAAFMPFIFETGLFSGNAVASAASDIILQSVGAYTFFAFLTTLIREIIKDMEDVEGDDDYGYRTLPIVWGMKSAKVVVVVLCILMLAALVYVQKILFQSEDFLQVGYILVTVQAPMVTLIFNLASASVREDYGKLSSRMKLVMFFGVLSIAVFYILGS